MFSRTKKGFCMLLTLGFLLSSNTSVLALDYTGKQGNEATFETLEETRMNSPAAVAHLEYNVGKEFESHPVLDNYPENTVFVYRSADLYGGRAAARLNTNLLVFSDKNFAAKDDAYNYLKELGLIDIIDGAVGSVVLITPADPEVGFTAEDQKNYYKLQTAMLAQKEGYKVDDVTTYYSDAEYFGGFGYIYAIGIDDGATFFNNYISTTFDYSSRIAGALLINSEIDEISDVSSVLPVYLVNPSDSVQTKYQSANKTDSIKSDHEVTTFYNQGLPLQQVIISKDSDVDIASVINRAYNEMFIKSMRIPVVKQGLYTAGTPYQGYGFDETPYSLSKRNPLIDGVTPDGIVMTMHQEDRFADIKTDKGEYLQTWFEYIPQEVLDGEVKEHSVPLILANHGGSDDTRGFVDENGWLALAGQERFIMVAPEKDYLTDTPVLGDALGALVFYMIETYPAIDLSRVYATGYSKGGAASIAVGVEHPDLIAAIAAMAPADYTPLPEDEEQFKTLDIPYMFTTSSVDKEKNVSWSDGSLQSRPQAMINNFMRYNEMEEISYDFDTYPIVGFKEDAFSQKILNNEHENLTWYKNNEQGIPMLAISFTRDLVHALYPEYAKIGWDYLKHFSRDLETGEVIFTEYVH